MASKPIGMSAPARHLLDKLMSKPLGWYWRDDLGVIQPIYSAGVRALKNWDLIEVRRTSQSGRGRRRIEVRLKTATPTPVEETGLAAAEEVPHVPS